VNAARPSFRARLDEIRGRIEQSARRSGRAPDAVVLVAVVKQVDVERIREAVDAGLADLGENRVQEAEAAIAGVGRDRARWHMVGHLQRNKVGRALELFDRIHGIDSAALAEALSRRAAAVARTMPVLVEVNVSGEPSKFGVVPDQLDALLERVAGLRHLALDGLMMVGAPVARPEEARGGFAALRGLRDRAERALGLVLPQLSMGMSGDFEVAIEEGATMVRVGTALFGGRPPEE